VLVPEKTGAALVGAGMGTSPTLGVAVAVGGAPDWVQLTGAGVLVMNVTCGTVTCVVTIVTVDPVETVCVNETVVTGTGAAVVHPCGHCVIVIVVPGAVEIDTAGAVAGGGDGINVMELGTLVQMPGF
jgi:hypothetical protein